MNTIIIASGNFSKDVLEKQIKKGDTIICADGGATHLLHTDIVPHMIVGDLDSIDKETIRHFKNLSVSFFKFPPEKDLTDTELAVEFAVERGTRSIVLLGVTGTRLDHTLANIMLLPKLHRLKIKAKIVDTHNEISVIDKNTEVRKEEDTFVSLIPLFEDCSGVDMIGFKYPTDKRDFSIGTTLGISNEVTKESAQIHIEKGIALLIKSRD